MQFPGALAEQMSRLQIRPDEFLRQRRQLLFRQLDQRLRRQRRGFSVSRTGKNAVEEMAQAVQRVALSVAFIGNQSLDDAYRCRLALALAHLQIAGEGRRV